MLQFPTNIYPQNVAFDPDVEDSNNALKFVFHGDILTTAWFKIYNYATGELVSSSFYASSNRVAWHYNGEDISFADGTLGDGLSSGNDYVIQMMLTQSASDGSENIYDMPIVRGTIQENSTSSATTTLFLKDKISNIYEWQETNGICTPTVFGYVAAGAVIQIGTETRFINSYDRNTGELIVDSAFTVLPQKGDTYIIFANYLITPQYYFMCRSTPTLSVSAKVSDSVVDTSNPIIATASYSQAQQTMIKNYIFRLYWYNRKITTESSFDWRLLKTSPKLYSQNIEWTFVRQLIGVDNIDDKINDLGEIWYKVECEAITQEGMSITANTIVSLPTNTTSEAFAIQSFEADIVNEHMPDYIPYADKLIHQAVRVRAAYSLRPQYNAFSVTVYRRDLETNVTTFLGTAQPRAQGIPYMVYYDYLVPNKGSFEYTFVPRDTNGCPYINAISKTTINTDMVGYSITALIPARGHESYDYYYYSIGQCWKFVGEIEDSTVAQNLDRAVHVGYGNYISVSSTDVNYMSGTLSATIGAVDCSDKQYKDTINMVNAWRQFITQNKIFLLKSQKGDVWIVNITDSPNVNYQENYKSIPTTFSFSWAECCSLDKIQIVQ